MYTLVTGDNALILQTLKIGAAPFNVDGLTVKSRLVSLTGEVLTDEITNSSETIGSDWVNGIVAVVIPGAQTEDIDPRLYPQVRLETQVDDGTYEKTWFTVLDVTKGTIG